MDAKNSGAQWASKKGVYAQWDNAGFGQNLPGAHAMSWIVCLRFALFHVLTLCLDSNSSKTVVVAPVYRVLGSALSFFLPLLQKFFGKFSCISLTLTEFCYIDSQFFLTVQPV